MKISRRIPLISVIAISIFIFVGCIDYEKIVAEKTNGITDEQEVQNENIRSVVLGDLNEDGKQEKLELEVTSTEDVVLVLYSGLKILGKYELEKEYDYLSLKVYVADIDKDDEREIISLIKTSTREVNVVKIINQADNNKYELYDFPTNVLSNEAYSGFNASITAREGFVYLIESNGVSYEIDASRLYLLNIYNNEEYEKIEEMWNKIVESDFHGESLGVSDIYILRNENEETLLEVHEYIVGGDDKIIGYLVTEIEYNDKGDYTIKSTKFKEQVDVTP